MTGAAMAERRRVVQRGQRLTWATIGYNCLEAMVSIAAGIVAGSVALVGFGLDSVIEVGSSAAGLWRLRADRSPDARRRAERVALRAIGGCFLLLAAYVLWEAMEALVSRSRPGESVVGIAIAAGSLVVMPVLARAKRRVAAQLSSGALTAEARQTELCMYLSAILLGGLLLNALLGWWWADPAAALAMVPIIGREGVIALQGRTPCSQCAPPLDATDSAAQ